MAKKTSKKTAKKKIDREEIGFVLSESEPNRFQAIIKKEVYLEAEEYILIEHPDATRDTMVLGIVFSVKNVNASYTEQSPLVPFFQRGQNTQIGDQDFMVATIDVHGAVETDQRGLESLIPLYAAPIPGQSVYRATSEDVKQYIMALAPPGVEFGSMKNYEDIRIALSVPKLFMHLAILGVTGAGKSHSLKVLLLALKGLKDQCPPITIVDPHGEFLDFADEVLNPEKYLGNSIHEMDAAGFKDFLEDNFDKDAAMKIMLRAVDRYTEKVGAWPPKNVQELIDLLHDDVVQGSSRDSTIETALTKLKAQKVKRVFTTPPLEVREFVKPGKIVVLDMGQIDLTNQQALLARLLDKIYAQATELHLEGGAFASLLVLDEVQRYAPENLFATGDSYKISKKAIFNIAAQGRKFGIGLVVASQRPAYISKSVLAQCNTQLIFRLVAWPDIQVVKDVLGNQGILKRLPYQPTGDAILFGVASALEFPVVVKVDPLPPMDVSRDFSIRYPERLAKFREWYEAGEAGQEADAE